jgi:hypothetical protein
MWMENSVLASRAQNEEGPGHVVVAARDPMGFSRLLANLGAMGIAGRANRCAPRRQAVRVGTFAWGLGGGSRWRCGGVLRGGGWSSTLTITGGMGDSGTVTSSHRLGIRLMTLDGSLLCGLGGPGGAAPRADCLQLACLSILRPRDGGQRLAAGIDELARVGKTVARIGRQRSGQHALEDGRNVGPIALAANSTMPDAAFK